MQTIDIFIETEGTVVSGNNLQIIKLQSSPQSLLTSMVGQGGCHDIFCGLKSQSLMQKVVYPSLGFGNSKSLLQGTAANEYIVHDCSLPRSISVSHYNLRSRLSLIFEF